jgi:tetratricopeptide (TPR) repeat protein
VKAREAGLSTPISSSLILIARMMSGGWDEAISEAEQLRRQGRGTSDVLAHEIVALCERIMERPERLEEDLAQAEELLALLPDSADPLWLSARGRVLALRGETVDESVESLGESYRRNPGDLPTGIWLAQVQRLTGRLDDAMTTLTRILLSQPDWPTAKKLMAEVCYENQLPAQAETLAREVLADEPQDERMTLVLARSLVARGPEHREEAISRLEELRRVRPRNVPSRLLLGGLYLRQGHVALAGERFEEAAKVAGEEDRAKVVALTARIYRDANLSEEALRTLEKALEDDPDSLAGRMAYADLLFSLGRRELALESLREVLRKDPANTRIRRRLCEMHFEVRSDSPEIGRIIEDLRARDPDSPEVQYLEATHALLEAEEAAKAGEAEEARAHAERAREGLTRYVELEPQDASGHYGLGVARFMSGDVEGASEALESARGLGARGANFAATFLRVQGVRAVRLYREGRIPEAAEVLRNVVRLNPGAQRERRLLAAALLHLRQVTASEAEVRGLLEVNQTDSVAWALLGGVLRERGRPDEAVRAYERAVRHDPENVLWRMNLAQVLMELDEPDRALVQLEAVEETDQQADAVLGLRVAILLDSGRVSEALELAEARVEENPQDPLGYELKGRCLVRRAQLEEAGKAFETALGLEPSRITSLWLLLQLETDHKGRVDEALRHARAAVDANPGDARMLYALGFCQLVAGDVLAARSSFRSVVEQLPENVEARIQLARLEFEFRDYDRAHRVLEPVLEQAPWRPDLAQLMAVIQLRRKVPGLAERYYRMVLELQPDNAVAKNCLAWMLAEQKRPGARALAEEAVAHDPDDPDPIDTYGFVLAQLGETELAITQYERAKALYEQRIQELELGSRDVEANAPHVRAKLKLQAQRAADSLKALEARLAKLRQ